MWFNCNDNDHFPIFQEIERSFPTDVIEWEALEFNDTVL